MGEARARYWLNGTTGPNSKTVGESFTQKSRRLPQGIEQETGTSPENEVNAGLVTWQKQIKGTA